MRNLILSTLSTLALLIHPLSLSAQNSFSISLDVNDTAGDQAVTSLNVSADQVVAIQIFGKDIQNANGLAVRFEYDASQVTYDGFDAGDVLPNAQALPEQGTNPTFVEIGIASLGGQATANSGLVGTVRFRATAAFSGAAIRLVRAELSRGGRFETIMPNISIALQGAPTPTNFSLSLDVDGSAGDQAVTSVDVSTDEIVAIQIFGTDIQNANGVSIRFEYDASQVTYEGFDVGNVLPNAQALPEQGTNPTFVEIGIVSFGGQATANSGLFGTIRFRTLDAFSGTAIRLVRAELSRGGQIASTTIDIRVELTLQVLTPDFNRDGMVNFADFLAFGGQYGARQGDGRYDAKYDLDSDGAIGFGDFLIFGNSYGQDVSTPGGGSGGGGGTGSPDLIVESPSVNDSTLTTGQSFTLQATVRNQGSGQAAATTLRYYQSVDAIISSSDTRVGSNAVGSLNASSRSIESISLNAPSSGGTYYYGACVSSVSGESNTNNNCSRAVRVTVSSGGSTTNVDIPDANLRAAIETALRKASGTPITRAEMATLTRLGAPNKDIRDLTGLEFATDLTWLDLGIEYVNGYVFFNSNEISNLLPLSGLTKLISLQLDHNMISDISALSGLTKLEWLTLDNNIISDVSVLSDMTNLKSLDLEKNIISDISSLSGLINLIHLDLGYNIISDVSVLWDMTNLTSLWLWDNVISDISALSGLTKLDRLGLDDNVISDISALSGLTSLETLYLYNNSITDITPLSSLNRMETLGLANNPISDISALSGLTNLRDLYSGNITISDVSVLANLTKLERLYLEYNLISDVSALSTLTKLERLKLYNNIILDVSALSNLTNLTKLALSSNVLSDISALGNLTNLTELGLGNNSILDISPLSGLTNLTELYLFDNTISDIVPLVANMGLGEGDYVDLRGNPLNTTSLNTHIPALQSRGVEISFDPTSHDPTPVSIPDANLRAAIETSLNKARGATITRSEILKLTRLDARNANINDLTGLEFATNLQTLDLGSLWSSDGLVNSNAISDFSALSSLTNLTRLDLDSSGISDLSALVSVISGLTNLQTLELSNNSISDISVLSSLTNLTNLNLGGELYSSGTSGVRLRLDSNTISDISPLLSLTNLQSLNLSGNDISDFSPLSSLTNLTDLELINAKISNLSSLSSLTGLTHLNLAGSTLSDLSPLRNLTSLTSLDLFVTEISDVSALSRLTNLEQLDLSDNNISDITPLSGLTNLEQLELSSNNISDITLLSSLTNLTWLALGQNSISDISHLSGLNNLTGLNLWYNSISNISALSGLTNLTSLTIDGNSISDITLLSSLTNLTWLALGQNSISDISALSGLTSLEYLRLDSNGISNLAPLVSNTGLGSGDEVYVRNNPLSAASLNTHIPALQDRGVTVQFGSSKPAIGEELRRMPQVVMNELKGVAREHRGDLFE